MANICNTCNVDINPVDELKCPCQKTFHKKCIKYVYEDFFECKECIKNGICEACLHHHILSNEVNIHWIECDACEGWYHKKCLKVPVENINRWFCAKKGCQLIKRKHENLDSTIMASPSSDVTTKLTNLNDQKEFNSATSNVPEQSLAVCMSKINEFLNKQTFEDLPEFNGDPAKWNIFYDAYKESNKYFSNYSNSRRVIKALGPSVKQEFNVYLDDPNEIESCIQSMNEYYGAPRKVIKSVVEKIKMSQINEMKPSSVSKFARLIESLANTLKKTDPEGIYFSNYTTLDALIMKLPWGLRKSWFEHTISIPTKNNISIDNFAKWLKQKSQVYDLMEQVATPDIKVKENTDPKKMNIPVKSKLNSHTVIKSSTENSNKSFKCWLHKSNRHTIRDCGLFLSKSEEERLQMVNQKGACIKCAELHSINNCPYSFWPPCSKCGQQHHELLHTLLHKETTEIQNQNKEEHSLVNNHTTEYTSSNLLKMVPVKLSTSTGEKDVLAFLDCGSTITLINKSLADELGMKGQSNNLTLVWTAGEKREEPNSELVSFKIKGLRSKAKEFHIKAHTVQQNIGIKQNLDLNDLKNKHKFLRGIEFDEYPENHATILIGLDNKHLITTQKLREGRINEPTAELTRLGWTVYGISESINKNSCQSHFVGFQKLTADEDFEKVFQDYILNEKRFEDRNEEIKEDSNEMIRSKEILASTTKFIDGRWHTGLLWKDDDIKLPNSFPMAMQRLRSSTLKAKKEGNWNIYREFINDFIKKGYAEKLSKKEANILNDRTWILPHFLIFNPNKNKPRLVWDAAAEIDGESLNKNLLVGPDLYTPLTDVIFKFREGKFAYGGDIKEMFMQIKMIKSDRDSLRFLFWDNEDSQIDTYRMTSMIFGSACSPTSAIYIRDLNADRFQERYPKAVTAIKESTYMDDFLHSSSTADESKLILNQVREIHSAGGFNLVGLIANDSSILNGMVNNEEINNNANSKLLNKSSETRILGLKWNIENDTLSFSTTFPKVKKDILELKRRPTMKEVLSVEMSIFDPNQYAAHFMIGIKLILQELWNRSCQWNDEIPDDLFKEWEKWIKTIKWLEEVKIPRCYASNLDVADIVELHVFCDASKKACAAVAYIRVVFESKIEIQIVAAKSKLAPRKQNRTVPELELMAAVIGTELAQKTIQGHHNIFTSIRYWTDSKIIMSWVAANSNKFRPYVANRIKKLQERSKAQQWSWVATDDMPADLATKWYPSEKNIGINSLWFRGPEFFRKPENEWPNFNTSVEIIGVHQGERDFEIPIDENRFSNWHRLVRVTAYVKLIIECHKKKDFSEFRYKREKKFPPSSELLIQAEKYLYRKAQRETYKDEYEILKNKKVISNKSHLYKLNPYIDEDGLIRAQGRLQNAEILSIDTKKPVVLPKNHRITELIIIHQHEACAHQGINNVINKLLTKFYISSMRATVKKTISNKCMMCKVRKATPVAPQMSNLPDFRLAPYHPPFSYVAIDLCGPFEIIAGRSVLKRYPILFSCLTTRALHVEIAHSLSADSFILNYRNFVALCNQPKLIISDRGTNLVGAESELKKAFEMCNSILLSDWVIQTPAKWEFLPAKSPHMNGAVERMVKSVKQAFYIMIDELNKKHRRLNDESFRSILMEVVGIINCRPITHVSTELGDTIALTPNHFLMRCPDSLLPLGDFTKPNLKSNWKNVQYLANIYWKNWCEAYLPTLSVRSKWHVRSEPLKVGDLVVTMDSEDRGVWRRGRIEKANLSKDGQARSYEVRVVTLPKQIDLPCSSKIITRPAIKLSKLEV